MDQPDLDVIQFDTTHLNMSNISYQDHVAQIRTHLDKNTDCQYGRSKKNQKKGTEPPNQIKNNQIVQTNCNLVNYSI